MAKTIYCLQEMAYQFDGETDLKGGGELWLEDFITLLKKNGYNVKLYQFSYKPFAKYWRGHWIIGMGNMNNPDRNQCYLNGFVEFHKQAEKADGVFYLSMNLSNNVLKKPSLTVSHGLMFDRCEKDLTVNTISNLDALKRWVRDADHVISVDTNTIKVNAVYYPDNIKKMTYIPNYVDLNLFSYQEKADKDKFTILYPRRLDVARGYRTVMESADILLEKYPNIEFVFCGKGNEAEESEFGIWATKHGDRVKHFNLDHDKMPEAYKNADISLIPTWYAEGTSLSCLESQASGIVPIVTTVGGLTDIVMKDVNGLMISPKNTNELTEVIEYLYLNPDEIERMRNNCLTFSKQFCKDKWEKRVMNVVKQVYGES